MNPDDNPIVMSCETWQCHKCGDYWRTELGALHCCGGFTPTKVAEGPMIRVVPGDCPLRSALEAVLMFHSGGSDWESLATAWFNRVQRPEATSKTLCDHIRAVLSAPAKEPQT